MNGPTAQTYIHVYVTSLEKFKFTIIFQFYNVIEPKIMLRYCIMTNVYASNIASCMMGCITGKKQKYSKKYDYLFHLL